MVPVGFERTLVNVVQTCSLNRQFAFAAKSLVAHHGHDFRLGGSAVATASTDKGVDRVVVIDRLHHRRGHKESQHQFSVESIFLRLRRQPHVELLPTAQRVQEVRLCFLPIVQTLYLEFLLM